MVVLESHLSLLEREAEIDVDLPPAERAAVLDEVIGLHLAVFSFMERLVPESGVTEADRKLVPQFQKWLKASRNMMSLARSLRAAGSPVASADELARVMNHAKPIAELFDETIAMNDRIRRGEVGENYSIEGVRDELRRSGH